MKHLLYISLFFIQLNAFSQTTYDVTFTVNMATEITSDQGACLAGGGPEGFGDPGENVMSDADGDDIWSITVTVPEGYSTYYAFTNGICPSWGCKENLGGLPCGDPANYNDRFLDPVMSDMTISTCFGQCSTDGSCAELSDVNVTFSVNMNDQPVVNDVYITGQVIDGWCGNCTPLSDIDGDGVYEVTLTLPPGGVEYKFTNGGWNGLEEVLDPEEDAACTLTSGTFTNRYIEVGTEDVILNTVCYNSCDDCNGVGCIDESLINPDIICPTVIDYVCGCNGVTYTNACFAINEGGVTSYTMGECVNSASVTFQVDMSQETISGPIYITGQDIDGWCGTCETMDDADGDGIYTYTTELSIGTHEYKFNNGGWDGTESLETEEDGACTITTVDGDNEFVNRVFELTSGDELILDVVCFNSCDACNTDPVKDDVAVTFSVDMSQEFILGSLYITGASIDGWDGASVEMMDDNGDGVYEVTVDLAEGTHEYKFNNGGWDGTENLDPAEDALCTVTTDGFTNRVIELEATVSEVQVGTVCFNSCDECEVENIIEGTHGPLFSIYPTVTTDFTTLKFHGNNHLNKVLIIHDIAGKMILRKEISGFADEEIIDVSSYDSGLYILSVITDIQSNSIRLIKSK